MTPIVSVIVPTFNRADVIGETLASIAEQSLGDLECIVVDDCSTDDTRTVVESWCTADSRFRFVSLPSNSGRPSVPRNHGLRLASGRYVAFVDSDDIWLPSKLQRQVDILDARLDLTLVHSYLWDFTPRSHLRGLAYLPNPYRRRGDHRVLNSRNVVQCSSVLCRREALMAAAGFNEDPGLRSVEDYELWYRLSRNHRFGYLSEVHGRYRWTVTGTSGQEDWLARHRYLDENYGTSVLTNLPNRYWQVTRKVAGFPLAVFFHLIEAPVRRLMGIPARVW